LIGFGYCVSLPSETPGIASATAQKDKAAVVLITTLVEGTLVYPSFEFVFVGGSIEGTWQHPEESFTFNADGSFRNWNTTQGYDFQGTYSTTEDTITLTYTGQAPVNGTYLIVDNTLRLSFPSVDAEADYERITGSSYASSIESAKAMQLMVLEGTAAKIETDEVVTGAAGTGFIVSSDGYILTNAHVVMTGEDNEQELLEALFAVVQVSLVQEFGTYYNLSQEEQEQTAQILSQKFMEYFLDYGSFQGVTKNIYVSNGKVEQGEDLKKNGWQAIVKKEGSIKDKIGDEWTWGRDVAVIKVNKTGLPTVRLGDSEKVEPGEKLFIIGYPDTGLDEFFEPTSLMEPTVSEGVVSAKRTLKNGIETIQTTAAINHGNSGGPVYNNKGEVIGLATFGVGAEVGIEAIKFCMPINLGWEYLNELNAKNEKSALDSRYEEALNAFWTRDCETAIQKFGEALTIYPEHPFAGGYIKECNRAIQAGEIIEIPEATPTETPSEDEEETEDYTVFLIAIVAIASCAGAYYFFVKGKKGASKKPAAKPEKQSSENHHFCPKCGEKIEASDKYCENCGEKI